MLQRERHAREHRSEVLFQCDRKMVSAHVVTVKCVQGGVGVGPGPGERQTEVTAECA